MGLIARQLVEPSGTLLIRVQFWPDSTGIRREWLPFELFGTLLRYTALVLDPGGAVGTYSITLQDVYGADMLLGSISAVSPAATPAHGHITAAIASRGQRPVAVGGRYQFEFDGDPATPGVFALHMTRDLAARFDHRGLTR